MAARYPLVLNGTTIQELQSGDTITGITFSDIGSKPTTLSGYGITDAQPLDADLTAIAALTGTSGFLKTNGSGTWSVDTASYLALTGGTLTGNLTFSGNGRRIIGDFDNATLTNRAMFQTSTTNGVTDVNFIPNGTGTESYLTLNNSSDPTNAARFQLIVKSATAVIEATKLGTGSYLPISVYTSGTERAQFGATGALDVKTGLRETKVAMAANAIDLATGNYFTKTISTATALTVSNTPSTGTVAAFVLDLTNGGAGTITWWSGMKWVGGTAPTLTASGRDVLAFFTHDGGTTWSGFVLGKDVK